jgi:aminopeptidase-like protein
MAMLWVLNFSDGQHSLLEIAERSQMEFHLIQTAAKALCQSSLLKEASVQQIT